MELIDVTQAAIGRTIEEALIARETLNVQLSQRELDFVRASMRVLQEEVCA